jgi:hypothetical protein
MSEPQQPGQGMLERAVASVKGLSVQNLLTIVVLIVVLAPTYLLWRLLNDSAMLGRVLSSYEEVTSDKWPCTLRIASARGAGDTYSISAGFAFQGSERWTIAVLMDRKPTDEEMFSYCETLQLLIDAMRDPTKHPPPFPGTQDEIIHMYPNGP